MRIIPAKAKRKSKLVGILALKTPVKGIATKPEITIPIPITKLLPHFLINVIGKMI